MSKTILAHVNGWTPMLDSLVQEFGLVTAAVFGRIWRYCQMPAGICSASMETIGDKPSLRFEVNIAQVKTLYPVDVKPPEMPGITWTQVKLNRTPAPYEHNNKPVIRLDEIVKQYAPKPNFQHRFVHDDRGVANIIYGYEKNLPPLLATACS